MSVAPRLLELQALDLEIEATDGRLAEIEAVLGETEALLESRSRLHDAQARLREQETQQSDLEMQIGSRTDRIKDHETRMYGGTVRSPRELGSLEVDTKSLRSKRSGLEDQELELMEVLDATRTDLKQLEKEYTQAQEDDWQTDQARLRSEQAQLKERVAARRCDREVMAASIAPPTLASYETLRRTKRGRAVALVDRSTCQGCRITLPTQEVQKARLSTGLVFCSSCGRILCVSR